MPRVMVRVRVAVRVMVSFGLWLGLGLRFRRDRFLLVTNGKNPCHVTAHWRFN